MKAPPGFRVGEAGGVITLRVGAGARVMVGAILRDGVSRYPTPLLRVRSL